MSKTLSTVRNKLNEIIGEKKYSGTTSSDGAEDYTTAVDSSLANYPDNFFVNWYLYTTSGSSTLEERRIKLFDSPSGTLTVWEAFSAQVASGKSYTLSRFSIDEKMAAINRALVDCFPYFYSRVTGVLIGEHTDDKDDRKYAISSIKGDTFSEIPDELYIQDCWTGEHDGDDDASVLTDSSQDWDTNELVGQVVYNKTDGSYGTITANTSTTVTATLAHGTGSDWDTDDEYLIPKNIMPERFFDYQVITGDRSNFYADVTDDYLIQCVGRAPLTAFTSDTSATELNTDEEAEIVALKGAANLYQIALATIDSSDRADFEKQIATWNNEWGYRIRERFMPPMEKIRIDWSWTR